MPPSPGGILQRQCACGQHTGGGGECEECKKKKRQGLQRAAAGAVSGRHAPPIVHDVLRSPGRPLDTGTRAFMESQLGRDSNRVRSASAFPWLAASRLEIGPDGDAFEREAERIAERVDSFPPAVASPARRDFSRVRVHTDPLAAESARAVNALAYTVGSDVVFGAGQYAPGSASGRRLLAHELTHVVQQSQSSGFQVQRKGFWGAIGGFFSSLAHIFFDYSDSAIREYLDLLDKTGDIEGDPDSDDKARQIVRDKKHLTLSVKVRTLLVAEMLDGWTSGADESAIIQILGSATPADRNAIIVKVGRAKIWNSFSGENRRIVEALTLTADDLKDSGIMTRLRGLSESQLVDYQKNAADPEVAKAIDKILREKRHELGSYPEEERRKLSLGGTFVAGAAEVITSDLEAAKAEQSKPAAIQQTPTMSTMTRGTVETIDVPEIRIPAGVAFEFETKIGKESRPGLERVARHMISESNLPQNTTQSLAIKDLGRIYRFSRFDHRGAAGSTELVLIEETGPIPATVEVPETGWNVNQPRPGAMPAGSLKIRAFDFNRDQDWRDDEWKLVVEALTAFPDSVLKEVAGVTFKRRPCQEKFIKDGLCIPRATRTGEVEAGERTGGNVNNEAITLFDDAFATSPSRYGSSTVLVSVLAHEVGHQVDLRSLDVALDTYNKGTEQARAELDKALAEPEPAAKGKKPKKPTGEKSKADLASDKYDTDKAALKDALDKARSLSGVGWQDDGRTRTLTEAPAGGAVEFLKAAALDSLALTDEKVTSGSITEYGKKNIVEQFAELFSVYLTDPKLLQAIRPNVYAYFAARFPR
jgi:hypothetical protein